MPTQANQLHALARDIATRAVVIVGLAGIALIHLLDSIGKYGETRYLFWMYVGLIAGSLAVAGALLHVRDRRVWLAAAGVAASAIVGFVLSRTTGLPAANGDIGNWTEPLGLASLFVEGAVVAVSGYAFAAARRARAIAGLGELDRRESRRGPSAASAAMR